MEGSRLQSRPSQNVVSQQVQPIRIVETIPAKALKKVNDTTYVFDFARNMSGVTRIKVSGEEGTVVRLKHGERLYDNGRVNMSNIDVYHRPVDDTDPFQTDILFLSGKEKTSLWHGSTTKASDT